MIILNKNGSYIYNKFISNSDWTGKAIQIIDDNSELGKKIISMIPYIKLIYENGKVVDVVEVEHEVIEPETPVTETEKLRADVDFLLIMGGFNE